MNNVSICIYIWLAWIASAEICCLDTWIFWKGHADSLFLKVLTSTSVDFNWFQISLASNSTIFNIGSYENYEKEVFS